MHLNLPGSYAGMMQPKIVDLTPGFCMHEVTLSFPEG
jgi:hypothetical protein